MLHGWLKWHGRAIDVTAPTKRSHPGINAHRAQAIERMTRNRIPVTPRIRTVVDLARVTDDATLTRAVRAARLSERELAALPRRGKFARILSAAPTASPLEDIVLDIVLEAGFEHPRVDAPYVLPAGSSTPTCAGRRSD